MNQFKQLINLHTLNRIFIGVFFVNMVIACETLLEQDISGDVVVLNSPPDGLHSTKYSQTFWWEKVKGATSYNLQIVSPSFDYKRKLVLDTNVTDNQFTYTFYPDTFAWRVKAYNPAYETEYTYATFYIDSTEGPQEVILIKPYNNTYTNDSSITFSWYKATNASNYRILIKEGEDVISTLITYETSIKFPDNTLGTPLLIDGNYTWTVRSENEVGWSDYAPGRNLGVDRTAPSDPNIDKPIANDTVSTFTLIWNHPNNGGSPISDSLIIYSDSLGTKEWLKSFVNDTVFTNTGATSGNWFVFKVKSVDAATNQSGWSQIRRFYYEASTSKKK